MSAVISYIVDIATIISVILLYLRTSVIIKQYQKDSIKEMMNDEILQFVASEEFERALDKSVISKKINDINDKLNQLIIAICITNDEIKDSPICKKTNGG